MKNIIIGFILVFSAFSCSYNGEELPTPGGGNNIGSNFPTITYTNHTKRLFDKYCLSCHAVGESVAFWPLSTFPEVDVYSAPGGKLQVRVLNQGNMPPSGTATGFLTSAEKDTLQAWINQGALQ